jgi:hypothetical protein
MIYRVTNSLDKATMWLVVFDPHAGRWIPTQLSISKKKTGFSLWGFILVV